MASVMLFGGCAGSTAGGVKVSRIVLLCKSLRRDLRRVMHSREVRPITLDGHRVTEETVSSVSVFFFTYISILLLGTLILSLDNIGPWCSGTDVQLRLPLRHQQAHDERHHAARPS